MLEGREKGERGKKYIKRGKDRQREKGRELEIECWRAERKGKGVRKREKEERIGREKREGS